MRHKSSKAGNAIIELKGMSKVFYIPHEKRATIAESIIGAISKGRVKYEKFYALKNISLSVKKGEFIGIIGPNGSGKTTLLKVIAGILEPDNGAVKVKGKVIPFLELGIGFVQELTAKENIYLYGSLLGMSKKDIDAKFDSIIDFAEIRKFIDAPLKDFSTGMLARLAFSIAKEVDGDIYLIDEVLAVGDDNFQKKCVKVFEEFKQKKKTLIFVSHNIGLISSICKKAIYLRSGIIQKNGGSASVCSHYACEKKKSKKTGQDDELVAKLNEIIKQKDENLAFLEKQLKNKPESEAHRESQQRLFMTKKRWGSGEAEIISVQVLDENNQEKDRFRTGELLKIRVEYDIKKRIPPPEIGLGIYNETGYLVAGPNNYFSRSIKPLPIGKGYIDYIIEKINLLEGNYYINVAISKAPAKDDKSNYDYRSYAAVFKIMNKNHPEKYGLVAMNGKWECKTGVNK